MAYRPADQWWADVTAQSRTLNFVLVIEAAPYNFSTRPVRPKSTGGSDWNTADVPLVSGALEVRGGGSEQLYPKEGRYALGDRDVQLTDVAGRVTRMLGTELELTRLYHRTATIYMGTAEMPEDQYQPIYVGLFDQARQAADGAFQLKLSSLLMGWDRDINSNAGDANASVLTEDLSAPYDTFRGDTNLSDVDDFYNGWTIRFVRGKNHKTDLTVQDYTGATREFVLSPAASNPIKEAHEFEASNIVTIQGNPINIWVRYLLSDFATTGQIQTDYPLTSVSGSPTGLGYVAADLDEPGIKKERDLWVRDDFKITFTRKETARQMFEREFFKVLLAAPTVTRNGKFGFRMGRPAPPPRAPLALTAQDLEGVPRWTRDHSEQVNRVKVLGDHDWGEDKYQVLVDLETPDTRYTEATVLVKKELEVRARGLHASLNGVTLADALARRHLARFGRGGPEVLQVQGGMKVALLEVGERIQFTGPHNPDISTATKGKVAESFEVLRVNPDEAAGRGRATLMGFYPGGKPMFMGPASIRGLAYADADADQRQYGFFGDAANELSDGSPGYRII